MSLETRESFDEYIYNNDGVPTYCKMRTIEAVRYGFWIPAIRSWFWPCNVDQDKLHKMFIQARELKFDASPIELKREWRDVTPDDEPPIEEHPATEEEQNTLEWF